MIADRPEPPRSERDLQDRERELSITHPLDVDAEPVGDRAASAFLALAAAIGPEEGETPADTVRRHLGNYTPPDPDQIARNRREHATAALAAGPNPMAEVVIALLDERATVWENGYQSGMAEGRKAASTQTMLEGSVFRLFDPRPIVAALAEVDRVGAYKSLGPAVRQMLADAGVRT